MADHLYQTSNHRLLGVYVVSGFETKYPRTIGFGQTSIQFFSANIVIALLAFISSVIIARQLGPGGHGTVSMIIMSATLAVSIATLGVHQGTIYYLGQNELRERVLATALTFAICMSVMVAIGAGIFNESLLAALDMPNAEGVTVLCVVILAPLALTSLIFEHALVGQRLFRQRNTARILQEGMRFAAVLVLVIILDWQIPGALLAAAICLATGMLYMLICLLSHNPVRLTSADTSTFWLISGYGMRLHLGNLLQIAAYRIDMFLVSYFLGVQEVGRYFVAVQLAELLWQVPNAVGNVLFPLASAQPATFDGRYIADTCRRVIMLTAGLAFVLVAAGSLLIAPVFGSAFAGAVLPFVLLVPGIVAMAVHKVLIFGLMAKGKPAYMTYSGLFTLILTIVFDLLLIPSYGLSGAAVASTIAYTASAVLTTTFFMREYGVSPQELLRPRREDLAVLRSGVPYFRNSR